MRMPPRNCLLRMASMTNSIIGISKKHGEKDFLVEINGIATPIEIKSDKPTDMLYYNHSALNNAIKTYGYERAYVFGETNVIKKSDTIIQMPLYMLDFLRPHD